MKSQVLYTVWCNIFGEVAGEIWNWSLLGWKDYPLPCWLPDHELLPTAGSQIMNFPPLLAPRSWTSPHCWLPDHELPPTAGSHIMNFPPLLAPISWTSPHCWLPGHELPPHCWLPYHELPPHCWTICWKRHPHFRILIWNQELKLHPQTPYVSESLWSILCSDGSYIAMHRNHRESVAIETNSMRSFNQLPKKWKWSLIFCGAKHLNVKVVNFVGFHAWVQKVHSPNLPKEKYASEVVRIGSIISFHLNKLQKATFSILCGCILWWDCRGILKLITLVNERVKDYE